MSSCGIVTCPGALPTLMRSAPGRRQVEQRLHRQPVVHHHVGPAQHLVAPRTVSSPGSPGPAPTRYTVMDVVAVVRVVAAARRPFRSAGEQDVGRDLAVAEVLEQLLDHVQHRAMRRTRVDLEELPALGDTATRPPPSSATRSASICRAGRGDEIVQLGQRGGARELRVAGRGGWLPPEARRARARTRTRRSSGRSARRPRSCPAPIGRSFTARPRAGRRPRASGRRRAARSGWRVGGELHGLRRWWGWRRRSRGGPALDEVGQPGHEVAGGRDGEVRPQGRPVLPSAPRTRRAEDPRRRWCTVWRRQPGSVRDGARARGCGPSTSSMASGRACTLPVTMSMQRA